MNISSKIAIAAQAMTTIVMIRTVLTDTRDGSRCGGRDTDHPGVIIRPRGNMKVFFFTDCDVKRKRASAISITTRIGCAGNIRRRAGSSGRKRQGDQVAAGREARGSNAQQQDFDRRP